MQAIKRIDSLSWSQTKAQILLSVWAVAGLPALWVGIALLACVALLGLLELSAEPCSAEAVQNETTVPNTAPLSDVKIIEKHPVLALPGSLDDVEVFNSNSPEVIQGDGILLSTFPSQEMTVPDAHLNHALKGNVDFFLHHINNRIKQNDDKTVQLGLVVRNSGKKAAHVHIHSGATYLSQPDAPFVDMPGSLDNDAGNIFAGPGDRVANDILNGRLDKQFFPSQMTIQPGEYALLYQAPIPVAGLQPPLNGRTALFKIETDQPLYAALLSKIQEAKESPPGLPVWLDMLKATNLVQPRERAASPLTAAAIIYGRVSGVSAGSSWSGDFVHQKGQRSFDILRDQAFSAVIDTVVQGTFGTNQVQSAPMIVRYPDTAFSAHGNYGVWYKIHIPIKNIDSMPLGITVSLDTPIKNDSDKDTLNFFEKTAKQVFFRGTVRATSTIDDQTTNKSTHLVEHRGEQGDPVLELTLAPKKIADILIELVYPPDATPPQVLTVKAEAAPE